MHAGAWYRDMKHGEGKYTYPNKDIYVGEWKHNIRHGTGTYFFAMSMSQVCPPPNAFHCLSKQLHKDSVVNFCKIVKRQLQ